MIESCLYLTGWDCGLKLASQAEGLGRSAGREAHVRCLQMDWLCTKPPNRQTGNSWYDHGGGDSSYGQLEPLKDIHVIELLSEKKKDQILNHCNREGKGAK